MSAGDGGDDERVNGAPPAESGPAAVESTPAANEATLGAVEATPVAADQPVAVDKLAAADQPVAVDKLAAADQPVAADEGAVDEGAVVPVASRRRRSRWRAGPRWARACVVVGAVVALAGAAGGLLVGTDAVDAVVLGGVTQIHAIPDDLLGESIDGPINFLLIGLDSRNTDVTAFTGEEDDGHVLTDSIIIAHVPASHDRVYLVSLPRDLAVRLPRPKNDDDPIGAGLNKINAAFEQGAWDSPTSTHDDDLTTADEERGVANLIRTIDTLADGDLANLKFNGAAIINFEGFDKVVEAVGGVNMCVDEDGNEHLAMLRDHVKNPGPAGIYSNHYYADGANAYLNPDKGDDLTAGKFYPVGCYEMQPWEALDYSRQRYDLPDGDYGRERHQQQLVKAIMEKIGTVGTLTDLGKLTKLQKAAGDLLTLDLGGHSLQDWAYNLIRVRASTVTMIKTNNGKFDTLLPDGYTYDSSDWCNRNPGAACYQGLTADSNDLLRALADDDVDAFLRTHLDWVAADSAPPSVGPSATASGLATGTR